MMINRRKLITGLIAFGCAPAIVRVSSLMPVKVINFDPREVFDRLIFESNPYPPLNGKFAALFMQSKLEMLEITGITDRELYDNS